MCVVFGKRLIYLRIYFEKQIFFLIKKYFMIDFLASFFKKDLSQNIQYMVLKYFLIRLAQTHVNHSRYI